MSEYQYYEFLAIDRALTAEQINEVGKYSGRATITRSSFINEYNFGSFRGDTTEFLTKYFDAMVYVANWGTREFHFSIPKRLLDLKAVEAYGCESVGISIVAGRCLFDISRQDDGGGDWEDGGGYMSSLAPLRAEVISGDYRPLFLGWLLDLQRENIDAEEAVPPNPAGLGKLTAAQQALVDFIDVDEDLLAMMAAESAPVADRKEPDIAAMLLKAPPADKDAWLKDLLKGDDPHAATRILRKLQGGAQTPAPKKSSQTAGELLARFREHERKLREERAEQARIKKQKADAAKAAEREKELDKLAANVAGAWRNIDQLIGLKNAEGYRQAVESLKDLRDLALRPGGDLASYQKELNRRLSEHYRKQSFVMMAERAGLREPTS